MAIISDHKVAEAKGCRATMLDTSRIARGAGAISPKMKTVIESSQDIKEKDPRPFSCVGFNKSIG